MTPFDVVTIEYCHRCKEPLSEICAEDHRHTDQLCAYMNWCAEVNFCECGEVKHDGCEREETCNNDVYP